MRGIPIWQYIVVPFCSSFLLALVTPANSNICPVDDHNCLRSFVLESAVFFVISHLLQHLYQLLSRLTVHLIHTSFTVCKLNLFLEFHIAVTTLLPLEMPLHISFCALLQLPCSIPTSHRYVPCFSMAVVLCSLNQQFCYRCPFLPQG